MRLFRLWFWTLIALSACSCCLLLLALQWTASEAEDHGGLLRLPRLTTRWWTRAMSTRAAATTGMLPTSATATATTIIATTIGTTIKTTLSTQEATTVPTQQTTTVDDQLRYKNLCWRSGYSPASQKPANYTPEDFMINESRMCSGRPLLLFLVHSDISARPRRDLARRTWASLNGVNGHRLVTVFVVGAGDDAKQQAALLEESAEAADLIQVPCRPDGNPRTSACKALYSLHWANRHCSGAKFLMKVDDNVFVNVFHLVELVTGRLAGATNTFYCRTAANEARISEKSYVYYVAKEEWPAPQYPLHCKGMAYLMSGDLASRLLQCAVWRSLLPLEDVFVTGVLSQALGARMQHWTVGWDTDWMHPKHYGPAVDSVIVLASPDGSPMRYLQRRVWKAALVYSADLV